MIQIANIILSSFWGKQTFSVCTFSHMQHFPWRVTFWYILTLKNMLRLSQRKKSNLYKDFLAEHDREMLYTAGHTELINGS